MSSTTPTAGSPALRTRRAGSGFRPHGWLDRVFEIGIVLKGLNGLSELVGGLLLLLVSPERIKGWVRQLTQGELSEDPHDFIATHLLHTTDKLNGSAVEFGAAYLLIHGVVKIVLVVALLRNKIWAYPWMIGVLGAFIVYQVYKITLQPSAGLIALTVFDALIVALTVREWRVQRRDRAARSETTDEPAAPTVGAGDRPAG
ncbi:putative membrane protein [Friedmanniella endophytica]|uniref:Putative membrane protein n=1 Tax=Microlunatus kandeliicorticis TaxID=1759536 RepID=A0A7W3INZ5_9ACTN|nr:DUF2127 domain-containing protein [Microlunatus kandeliicorticis]MBA8792547.1 putative membrane protein [Microlunatus kandeliicorticis]